MRAVIDGLLQSNQLVVKNYLLNYIHGYFNIESLGLSEKTLESLKPEAGKTYNLKLILDTNFLFSILKLHDNPANELVHSIADINKKLNGQISITYCVHPRTIKEFQHSFDYEIKKLLKIKFSIPIAKAIVTSSSVSGFTKQFAKQYLKTNGTLKVNDYIDPYINSLTTIFKNFEISLYNASEDSVIKSDCYLNDLSQLNQRNEAYPENQRRGMSSIEHDLLLWHITNNARVTVCDTFLEAKIWIATIDHRFVSFDKSKGTKVPVCLEPSVILDLLQIWLPRDEILSEQLLNIIRIPLYSNEFIKDAEDATAKIISLISRFSSADGLSEETIHKLLLNKALREKIVRAQSEEEEIKLIQDNLLNFIEDANKEKDRIVKEKRLLEKQFNNKEIEVSDRDVKLRKLEEEQKRQSEAVNGLQGAVDNANNEKMKIVTEKQLLEANVYSLQQELMKQKYENARNDEWQKNWNELAGQWYHIPLTLFISVIVLYFGGSWLTAAFTNTKIASFDLKTLIAIPACIVLLWKGIHASKIKVSFQLIFLRRSFKEYKKNISMRHIKNKMIEKTYKSFWIRPKTIGYVYC